MPHEDLDEVPLGRREPDLGAVAVHPLGREVDGEVGGLDHRLLLGRRGAAQRGAEPGQQLVHAERLGDVVVGAGVEGARPCRVSPSRTDSTMIGTVLHPRRPADHLDAVDAGQAEVEHDDVGVVARPRASSACSPSGARSTS